MARPFPTNSIQPHGQIDLQVIRPGLHCAFFTPPVDALPKYDKNPEHYRRPIFEINAEQRILTVFPYKVWGAQPMSAKYLILQSISLEFGRVGESYYPDFDDVEGFLNDALPSVFVEDYDYGLGFKKQYRQIIRNLENMGIERLMITASGQTKVDLETKSATLSHVDLNEMRRTIDRITQNAQRHTIKVKNEALSNLFFQLVTKGNTEHVIKDAYTDFAKKMGASQRFIPGGATKKEQTEAIEVIRKNGRRISDEQPGELIKLRDDIELVTLEQLIGKYEVMLSKSLPESHWQRLFEANPFILNMAFSVPVIEIQGQAFLGGRKLSGAGEKITDFLVKNRITNNVAIVEIKTPGLKLLSSKEYRAGVFGPSSEIAGAINQVLDQIFQFQRHIDHSKSNSRIYDIESYAVTGVLVAGISLADPDEQKSFELFRGNSKNIQIITFDELLMKLKYLHSFLSTPEQEVVSQLEKSRVPAGDEDLPF